MQGLRKMMSQGRWLLFVAFMNLAVGPPATRGEGMVASDHPLASACGAQILELGGNAADAAVAVALCAGVVQPAGSGLGGGGFAVVRMDDLSTGVVVDFREVAPESGSRDMYLDADGGVRPLASRQGGLAVAVPAESRGLAYLVTHFGRLPHRVVAKPAIQLARRGFAAEPHLVKALSRTESAEVLREFRGAKGHVSFGEWLQRPALATTLQRWAATAGEDLHVGSGAAELARHVAAADGVLTLADLSAYEVKTREPIVISLEDATVVTMPPPSSGGVVLAQMLKVLAGHDLKELEHNSAAYIHLLAETMKHAYADRAHHLGDPDFVEVPVARLISDARVLEVRRAFTPETTHPPSFYGSLLAPPRDAGTQHISVTDASGAAVVLTTTINTSFGSGLVPPSLGIVLNNEMDDFSAAPGVPNAFGLVGGEANAIEARKRPLSSMSPTLVIDGQGRVQVAVGASGGSTIISSVLQTILNITVFDMDPAAAVAAPRVHHQWQPDVLWMEPEVGLEVREALEARGHTIRVSRAFSSVQAISAGDEGLWLGGSDPRKGGRPAAARARGGAGDAVR